VVAVERVVEATLSGEDPLLPALGEAIEAAYRDSLEEPLDDRSWTPGVSLSHHRRCGERYAHVAPMKIRAGGLRFAARSIDVSRGGMSLETATPPAVGEAVTVVFSAAGYPLELEATVAHQSPGIGVGVRFHSVPEEERRYLEALLQQLRERI
jgi:hypothetical protein